MKFCFFFFFSICAFNSEMQAPFYYFIPPKNWDLVSSEKLSKGTVIAFIEKSHKPFKASINLGIENTDMLLERYVEIARKKIIADRSNTWTSLGTLIQPNWKGHLAQIDSKNGCGDVRSFQCIISDKNRIYVLTGVCLKEDHVKNASLFMEIFESFNIQDSALSSLKDKDLKSTFIKQRQNILNAWQALKKNNPATSPSLLFEGKEFQKKYWLSFEHHLQKTYRTLGLFWQAQAAQELKNELFSNTLTTNLL